MIRFIDFLNVTDKILDCVPLISLVKNVGILLYQQIHKVQKVANPVNATWKDDIKIHVLSRRRHESLFPMIPIYGNLTALIMHAKSAIKRDPYIYDGYLCRASKVLDIKKHSFEIAALYLARNPNCPEEKLSKGLYVAALNERKDILQLILDSTNISSKSTILRAIKATNNADIARIILNKHSTLLDNKDSGTLIKEIINYQTEAKDLLELLIETYPDSDKDEIHGALECAAKKGATDLCELLKDKFPHIQEKNRKLFI